MSNSIEEGKKNIYKPAAISDVVFVTDSGKQLNTPPPTLSTNTLGYAVVIVSNYLNFIIFLPS